MAYLRCKQCGHFEPISTAKFRLIGLGMAIFGVVGWFTFLFAGSGHAFLIASGITIIGIVIFFTAKDSGKEELLKKKVSQLWSSFLG